jgi:hypothetical protein
MASEEAKKMYCSSCGTAAMQGLNYCKRCGAKLSGAKDEEIAKPAEPPPEILIIGMVISFVAGLGVIMGLMAVMKRIDFPQALITAFSLISFLMMLVIEGVFIWKLSGPRRAAKELRDTGRLKEQEMKELGAEQTSWIIDPAPSVSEHTTHTLEPIHSEPKLK